MINFCWLNDSPDSHPSCLDEERSFLLCPFNMPRSFLFSFSPHSATGTRLCPTTKRHTVAPSATLSQSYNSWMMPRCRWRSCSTSGRSSWTSSCSCGSLSSTPLRYGERRTSRRRGGGSGHHQGLLGQGYCHSVWTGGSPKEVEGIMLCIFRAHIIHIPP